MILSLCEHVHFMRLSWREMIDETCSHHLTGGEVIVLISDVIDKMGFSPERTITRVSDIIDYV